MANELSASPTPPIPMIAEAGEREHGLGPNAIVIEDEADGFDPIAMLVGPGNVYLQQGAAQIFAGLKQAGAIRAALSTPATLDNTAVEAETLRMAVKALLPIGDDRKPDSAVIPIYVRMSELRALRALTAKTEKAE